MPLTTEPGFQALEDLHLEPLYTACIPAARGLVLKGHTLWFVDPLQNASGTHVTKLRVGPLESELALRAHPGGLQGSFPSSSVFLSGQSNNPHQTFTLDF